MNKQKKFQLWLFISIFLIYIFKLFPSFKVEYWIINNLILTRGFIIIFLGALCILKGNFLTETRWQLSLLEYTIFFFVLFPEPMEYNSIITYLHYIFMTLYVLSLLGVVFFPVPILPKVTGRYGVGTREIFLERNEKLLVKVWYPTDKIFCSPISREKYVSNSFIPYLCKNSIGFPKIFQFLIKYFQTIKTNSYLNVPLSYDNDKYPGK
jgi:hypothetical protein